MKIKRINTAFVLLGASLLGVNTLAYDDNLLDNPINVGVNVKPNILLLLDDSGSMRHSMLADQRAITAYRRSAQGINNLSVLTRTSDPDLTPDSNTDLLGLCSAINSFAYDPNKTYKPWLGKDESGVEYTALTPPVDSARINPYLSNGPTADLRELFYLIPDSNDLVQDAQGNLVLPETYKVINPDSTDPEHDTSENGVDGICGPLLRAYEEIPSYIMGYNNSSEANKGLLIDSGGPANIDEGDFYTGREGFYSQDGRLLDLDFTINNSGQSSTTLSFPEGISLAGYFGGTSDQIRIYADDKVGDPVYVFPDVNEATLAFGTVPVLHLVYTNNPGELVVNSSRVIIEFVSGSTVSTTELPPLTAEGFLIGWNLSVDDYPDKVNRTITKEECSNVPNYCQRVDELNEAELTNYMNWFSYHRTKDLIVKTSLDQIINGLETEEEANGVITTTKEDPLSGRVGLAVLNKPKEFNGNGDWSKGVGKIISDIDVANNRDELLTELYRIDPRGGTPLREALANAGEYFTEGNGNESITELFGDVSAHDASETLATDTPILTEDSGGFCQSNYTLLFTDGVWNGTLNNLVGNADADGPGIWDDNESFRDNEGSPLSNSLADVAMHYFERDLSSSLDNQVQAFDERFDANRQISHQHMVTSAISFGVQGNIPFVNPLVDFPFNPLDPNFPGWGDNRIDDLAHAAWNARGSFYSATTPTDVLAAFKDSIENTTQSVVTTSAGSLNTFNLSTDTVAYRSFYNTDGGYGDVRSYIFDVGDLSNPDDDSFVYSPDAAINGLTSWSADERLAVKNPVDRKVITFGATAPTAFNSNNLANLSPAQLVDLRNGNDDTYAESVIEYLRGVEDANTGFRSRTTNNGNGDGSGVKHLLGPIINSTPVYVDGSSNGYPNNIESEPYSEYLKNKKVQYGDTPLLFVGSNDGMLHAFYTDSGTTIVSGGTGNGSAVDGGDEVFAYVPSPKILKNSLHDITLPSYTSQAYVDGAMVSADVFTPGGQAAGAGSGAGSWKTYLVGGLRTGGKGLFALDISNRELLEKAESNASDILKWEFNHPELGYTFSQPQIAKMNTNIDGGSSWGVIVGNGYGVSSECGLQDDGTYDINANCGKASLFIIDINDPSKFEILETDTTLAGGSVDFSSTLSDKCAADASDCNGLSSPALVDVDGDFIVDRIYAGDLHGNMWVFDVSDKVSSSTWGIDNSEPLFAACRGTNCEEKQPITARPIVTRHPTQLLGNNAPNLMVYFGTGQFIDANDNTDNSTQSFYGVWDSGNSSAKRGLEIANLQEQTIENITSNGEVSRNISQEPVDYSSQFGWYMDLPGDGTGNNLTLGERVIASAVAVGDIIFFLTVNPNDAFCSAGGVSFLMGVNAVDGSNANFDVFNRFAGKRDNDLPEEAAIRYDGIGTGISLAQDADGNPQIVKSGSDGSIVQETANPGGISSGAGRKAWSIIH